MRILKALLPTLVICCAISPSSAETGNQRVKVIRFGKLIDGTGKVVTNAVVIINGDRIESVISGQSQIPSGSQRIDLSAYTGMPGIIDAHTHMTYWRDKDSPTTPNEQVARLLPQELVFLAQQNARKCIEIGVTTVRDMAATDYSDVAMRNLINRGVMTGPRMFVAGPAMMASGPMPLYGDVFPWIVQNQRQASGVTEVIRLIRQELGAGADFIKMFGSTGGFNDVETYQTFTLGCC